ncbi:calcium-dependent protein kinase 17-like [Prosopis cineraria]|uniref:calcium-dependent protein kinase 17-like n=1 Tax=Prosopis cineraria TaxID=364024 RepID=UPI00240ECF95|nr:calcium-dependent protein kinase 17-like [Prosopis cineraria]
MKVLTTTYSLKVKELGPFGVTHLITHKTTLEQFACKTIVKRKLVNDGDIEDICREVQIMHHLASQPNIVELKSVYKYKHVIHLVMELCTGSELFYRITAKQYYFERAAALLLRTIVQIVHTCHSIGVIHRDVKLENFLFLNKDKNSPLKLIDFDLSFFTSKADADGNGTIDYKEFITATLNLNRIDKEEHLYIAFQYFDKDNNRFITVEELEHGLKEYNTHDGRDINEILSEVDANNTDCDGPHGMNDMTLMTMKLKDGNHEHGGMKGAQSKE